MRITQIGHQVGKRIRLNNVDDPDVLIFRLGENFGDFVNILRFVAGEACRS
ncbi:hypothetical protein D3C81_2241860 [compost metagenome]